MNLLLMAVMMLILAIVIVVGYKLTKQLNSSIQSQDIIPQEAKDMAQNMQDKYVSIWDVLFLVLLVLMYLVLIASAWFVDTHPFFFVISMLLMAITAFIGGHLANAYSSFAEGMPSDSGDFTIIPYIFQHYIQILVIIGVSVAVALFAKLRSGE